MKENDVVRLMKCSTTMGKSQTFRYPWNRSNWNQIVPLPKQSGDPLSCATSAGGLGSDVTVTTCKPGSDHVVPNQTWNFV